MSAYICICCLSQDSPLLRLISCRHLGLLYGIPNFVVKGKIKYLCIMCHEQLKKFSRFREQVTNNLKQLYDQKFSIQSKKFANLKCTTPKINWIDPVVQFDRVATETPIKEEPFELDSITQGHGFDTTGNNYTNEDNITDFKNEQLDLDLENYVLSHVVNKNVLCEENQAEIASTRNEIKDESCKRKENDLGKELKEKYDCRRFEKVNCVYVGNQPSLDSAKEKKSAPQTEVPSQWTIPDYEGKINIITLSEKEMLKERDIQRKKQAYLKMEFKCEDCIVGFNYKEKYDDHIAKRHNLQPDRSMCEICTVTLKKQAFQGHYTRHFIRYECQQCLYRAKYEDYAIDHYNDTHEKIDVEKEYECSRCDFITTVKKDYGKHIRSHREKSIECTICKKTFKNRALYRIHTIDVHKKQTANHKCSKCPKLFSHKWKVRHHEARVHTDNRSFNRPAKLAKLKGVKDKICEHCGKGFSTNNLLKVHIRTHTGERPLSCKVCGATFAHPAALYNHNKLKHGPNTK